MKLLKTLLIFHIVFNMYCKSNSGIFFPIQMHKQDKPLLDNTY